VATYNLIADNGNALTLDAPYALTGSGYPGRLLCESEVIYVYGGAGTTQITVARGQDGTQYARHTHVTIADANIPTSSGGGTPTLAQVLAEGNSTGGTAVEGGTTAGASSLTLQNGTASGTPGITTLAGAGSANGQGGQLALVAADGTGSGHDGGTLSLNAGQSAAGETGGEVDIIGGYGDNGNSTPAELEIQGGVGSGNGGSVVATLGDAESGSNGNGGNFMIHPGAKDGTGRIGLVVISAIPTADPHVAGALWSSSGIIHISAG
jgi:hypothetical protein